jgi:transposase-like protein
MSLQVESDRTLASPGPTACPFCSSTKLVTTSKVVTDATYWRCEGCGQIWNPSRLDVRPHRNRW